MEEGGPDAAPLRRSFAAARSDDELLAREADTTLREFRRLAPESRAAIRPWVCEMCRGMAGFARLQAQVRPGRITALGSIDDLDRYCYYVAGTVGHLLSDLFAVHHQLTPRRRERLSALATSFGLGLQLTNIIKDVADDRARGWSFVPRQLCELAGIGVEQLGEAQHADAARKVMDLLIAKARRHLHDAREYCCTLPRSAWRTRLFCLTPLYFAVRTLERAAADPHLLDPGHKVKITRGEVYRIICMSHLVAPSNHLVRGYYQRLTARGRGGRERAGIAGLRG
jgi:farnesyl-diphosphate farnesyltransferase